MIAIDLTDEERRVLWLGVYQWEGPAMCTEALAMAMGFTSKADLLAQRDRLRDAIKDGHSLELWDWARALVLAEIAFGSDVFGAGIDWRITTGLSDVDTIQIIRDLQRKLTKLGAGRQEFYSG